MVDYEAKYQFMLTDPRHSEIIEHLPTLRRYASACSRVAEIGTHDGSSAFAMMMGGPGVLTCVDIQRQPEVADLFEAAGDLGIDFRFIEQDSLTAFVPPCDLLFIDSFHTGSQLSQELTRHAPFVGKYLMFHDTEIFGDRGEDGGPGLWIALSEFLRGNDDWRLSWHHTNNNGMTLCTRI